MNQPDPYALAALIKSRGLSYGEIAKAGSTSTHTLPRSTVGQLAKEPLVGSPRPDTLLALARGLGVPASTVQQAVAHALGYAPPVVDPEAQEIADLVAELSEPNRRIIRNLTCSLYREQ